MDIILDSLGGCAPEQTTEQKRKEIRVDNIIDRVSSGKGVLPEPLVTGQIHLRGPDVHRFKCSKCYCAIRRRLYVDSDADCWCENCWCRALESTIRNVAKNPDDPYPRFIHRGGKYYQRLRPKEYERKLWHRK